MSEEHTTPEQEENIENANPTSEEERSEASATTNSEEKYNELNDRYLRLYAEFDNYRKRSNKEKIDLISSASEGVLKAMLPILDDFERAIENNEKVEDIEALKEGFTLIYTKFKGIMEGKGLHPMNSVGEAFDSELHEAVANLPAEKEEDKGRILHNVEKGYYLHDKVIRYAKVVVGQ
jgi:molecular chaperone GrpE